MNVKVWQATLVILLAVGLYVCVGFSGCDTTYSTGYRDGTVQKLSHKGLLFKSWEGELAVAGFKAREKSESNIFEFSVADPDIVSELEKLEPGTFVRLHYRQVLINSFNYSTDYRILRVEIIPKQNRE